MKTRILWVMVGVLLSCSLAAQASAASITQIVVTIGDNVWSNATVGWPVPVDLSPGQNAIFTQRGVFNFDTSDALDKDKHHTPIIAITVDGVTTSFLDTTGILNVNGLDPVDNASNEAQNFGEWLLGPGYRLRLGYVDNVHTGPCGAWASSIGLQGSSTCLPVGFTDATYFYGAGTGYPENLPYSEYPSHCNEHGGCFDAGVIDVRADTAPVPEPASLAMLGFGLLGLVAYLRRQSVSEVRS